MSRPHYGQKTFFPFSNPLWAILPKVSHRTQKLLELLSSFEKRLAENLKKLKPVDVSDVLSFCWMRHAIEFLLDAHTNIKTLINELQFPVSEWDDKWIDAYFDSSVKLLDICIVFSSELSRLDQGQLLIQYVLHILDISNSFPSPMQLRRAHVSLDDWMRQMSSRNPKLENCLTILQSLQGTLCLPKIKNSAKGKVLMSALYGVKVITVFVCSIFAAAFLGCSKPLIDIPISDKFLWFEAYSDLQSFVNQEIRRQFSSGKVMKLKELEVVEVCIMRLHALINSVSCKEETLQQSNDINNVDKVISPENSNDFKERQSLVDCITILADKGEKLGHELDSVSKQVNDFFQIVLLGRDALLSNLRAINLTRE